MRTRVHIVVLLAAIATLFPAGLVTAAPDSVTAVPAGTVTAICTDLFTPTFGVPNTEPLGACQWNMALINAGEGMSYDHATGAGVTVGVIDSGVQLDHPDIAPNLDLELSCSFIFDSTPTADPSEIANGDCSNKAAVSDHAGHGTHVASIIGAPVNGIGIAGVAPEVTLVALKACTIAGFCFVDSVVAALRYAGDQGLDVVNLSLFADPFLYYCKNESEQRAMLKELEDAARYARQQGVVIVTSSGNEATDLRHPETDEISPDWPPDTAVTREVKNNCRVAPTELTGVMTVSATGPIGIPDYDLWIASYSTVGGVEVAAPGGDYFAATGTVQDAVLAALPIGSDIWNALDPLNAIFPGLTVIDQGAGYAYLNGTSMSSPHAAGVAALVREVHPSLAPSAVIAAVQSSAQETDCPPAWDVEAPDDRRCYGGRAHNSFFGHGVVDAEAAALG